MVTLRWLRYKNQKNDNFIANLFFCNGKILLHLRSNNELGVVAEWLGSGLQHHLQRFESARHLKKPLSNMMKVFSFYIEMRFIV